jgi:hypothetical protein
MWSSELAISLMKNDMFLISKITNSLKNDYFSILIIKKNDTIFYSSPSVYEENKCFYSNQVDINLFNKVIGSVTYCKELDSFFKTLYKSFSFWLFLSLFSIIILLTQISSLINHRNETIFLISYLENIAKNDFFKITKTQYPLKTCKNDNVE